VRIGVFSDAPRELAEIALAHAGAARQVEIVGTLAEVQALGASTTVVHDLRGRCVLPGFHDSHNHMLSTAYSRTLVDLSTTRTIDDVVRKLSERAEVTPPGQWVLSSGRWHETQLVEKRFPRRAELDAALSAH
jgi:predicted amidohydrolase YtcJ